MTKALLFTRPFHTRFLSTIAAAGLLALSVNACSKKKAEPEKAPVPSASATDPNADGKRLDRAVNDWKRRWERIELESCDALLKDAADLELCTKTQTALTKVKELAAKADKSPAAVRAAGELVEVAEAAVDKLRQTHMAVMGTTGATGATSAKPIASAAPRAVGSVAAKPKAKPLASGAAPMASGSAAAMRREDPATKLISSYERTARSAARYLGSFLQQGPLDVRQTAFAEVERLVPLRPRWLTLRDIVRQASLTERETDLRKKLRDLEQKLRASAPPGPAARPVPPPVGSAHP